MIGLYSGDLLTASRRLITYNGLNLNDPADTPDDTIEVNEALYRTRIAMVEEQPAQNDGEEAYDARKVSRVVVLRGVIRAPSYAKLFDKKLALAAAFDPVKLSQRYTPGTTLKDDNQDDAYGFRRLAFSTPTENLASYPTGFAESFYRVRAMGPVEPDDDYSSGFAADWEVNLLLRDPRRYLQAQSTITGGGAITNPGDYRSPARTVITMSGAGNAAHKITMTTTTPASTKGLTLNLSSLVSGNVVTVDHDRKLVFLGSTLRMDLFVSGDFWEIEPSGAGQSLSIAFGGGISSEITSWYPAFCI